MPSPDFSIGMESFLLKETIMAAIHIIVVISLRWPDNGKDFPVTLLEHSPYNPGQPYCPHRNTSLCKCFAGSAKNTLYSALLVPLALLHSNHVFCLPQTSCRHTGKKGWVGISIPCSFLYAGSGRCLYDVFPFIFENKFPIVTEHIETKWNWKTAEKKIQTQTEMDFSQNTQQHFNLKELKDLFHLSEKPSGQTLRLKRWLFLKFKLLNPST